MRTHLPVGKAKVAVVVLVLITIGCLYFLYNSNTKMDAIATIATTSTEENGLSDWELQAAHYKSKKEIRLKEIQSLIKENTTKLADLQMYMVPQMVCPTMVRVGIVGDGGKFVCNPWRVPQNCIVYSLGVNGEVSFETELFETTNRRCKFFSVDRGNQSLELFKPFNGVFLQAYMTGRADPARNQTSIADMMQRYNHTKVDIIKMDIEGWEFDTLTGYFNLANTNETQSSFCQLLVEFHIIEWRKDIKLSNWVNMFEELEKRGFRMFSREANMFWTLAFEYSFIHVTCFEQYGLPKHSIFATFFI